MTSSSVVYLKRASMAAGVVAASVLLCTSFGRTPATDGSIVSHATDGANGGATGQATHFKPTQVRGTEWLLPLNLVVVHEYPKLSSCTTSFPAPSGGLGFRFTVIIDGCTQIRDWQRFQVEAWQFVEKMRAANVPLSGHILLEPLGTVWLHHQLLIVDTMHFGFGRRAADIQTLKQDPWKLQLCAGIPNSFVHGNYTPWNMTVHSVHANAGCDAPLHSFAMRHWTKRFLAGVEGLTVWNIPLALRRTYRHLYPEQRPGQVFVEQSFNSSAHIHVGLTFDADTLLPFTNENGLHFKPTFGTNCEIFVSVGAFSALHHLYYLEQVRTWVVLEMQKKQHKLVDLWVRKVKEGARRWFSGDLSDSPAWFLTDIKKRDKKGLRIFPGLWHPNGSRYDPRQRPAPGDNFLWNGLGFLDSARVGNFAAFGRRLREAVQILHLHGNFEAVHNLRFEKPTCLFVSNAYHDTNHPEYFVDRQEVLANFFRVAPSVVLLHS